MLKKKAINILAVISIVSAATSGCTKNNSATDPTATVNEVVVGSEDNNTATLTPTIIPEIEADKSILDGIKLQADTPVSYRFSNASVHDPSLIVVDGTYYIFGSHLAGAKSTDLMNWTMIGSGVNKNNPIIPDAKNEMPEAFEWAQTDTFWAPDVIQLNDGRYYMYYCNCEGSSPLSCLGVAVSDSVEGPYEDLGIILKSGMGALTPSENGDTYNANIQPNAVDPCLYFDTEGRLWMMYGSYSGGIYVLEMDPYTGMPLTSGYGKKILGANHLCIEAAYVLYSPETKYYYMFLSYGGLAADGGYNIRVCRSKTPDGPFYDSLNQDMIDCKGPIGSFFDNAAAAKYGVKLMGNFHFNAAEGEMGRIRNSYVSPGHNTAYYDEETGKYFLIFHTRFENRGESHEVRVHQMFINEDGWPVVAPYRYVEETIGSYVKEDMIGPYKAINHMRDTTNFVKPSVDIVLNEDNTVSGAWNGTWELKEDHNIVLTLGSIVYRGVCLKQWDEYGQKYVMTFTVQSEGGVSIWGSGYAALDSLK